MQSNSWLDVCELRRKWKKVNLTMEAQSMAYLSSDLEKFSSPVPAKVEQAITAQQGGRVQCMASSWPARFGNSMGGCSEVPIGAEVLVWGREGITLLIQAV